MATNSQSDSSDEILSLDDETEVKDLDQEQKPRPRLNPITRTLLQGVYDEKSPLSMLRGKPHVLQMIWDLVKCYWKTYIRITPDKHDEPEEREKEGGLAYLRCWDITFPEPQDININMMPFVMGRTFAECQLPDNIEPYWGMIERCLCYPSVRRYSEIGKVGYLTIQESFVEENSSQRRPGIHTENPGKVFIEEIGGNENMTNKVCSISVKGRGSSKVVDNGWGHGWATFRGAFDLRGGIYMASSVENSCQIWDCQILQDECGFKVIGELGDIEHLRSFLPHGKWMRKNTIYWLTDRTPHESMPLEKGTYRQFFRLVTSEVSLWFEEHSTKNPKGIAPDPIITRIVKGSKFDGPYLATPLINNYKSTCGRVCCFQ